MVFWGGSPQKWQLKVDDETLQLTLGIDDVAWPSDEMPSGKALEPRVSVCTGPNHLRCNI